MTNANYDDNPMEDEELEELEEEEAEEQELHDSYWCEDCDCEVMEPEPGYECNSCGETFSRSQSADGDSNRCPECNKFAAKISDTCCPDCGAEVEPCQCNDSGERVEEE